MRSKQLELRSEGLDWFGLLARQQCCSQLSSRCGQLSFSATGSYNLRWAGWTHYGCLRFVLFRVDDGKFAHGKS